jgi:hypothetical protein
MHTDVIGKNSPRLVESVPRCVRRYQFNKDDTPYMPRVLVRLVPGRTHEVSSLRASIVREKLCIDTCSPVEKLGQEGQRNLEKFQPTTSLKLCE